MLACLQACLPCAFPALIAGLLLYYTASLRHFICVCDVEVDARGMHARMQVGNQHVAAVQVSPGALLSLAWPPGNWVSE